MKKEAGLLTFLFLVPLAPLLFLGCGSDSPPGMKEQRVQVSPEFFKTWPCLRSLNRWQMAFPELPTNGVVRILTVDRAHWKLEYPPPNYDVQLQFIQGSADFPHVEHNVFLKQTDEGSKWVREQVTFYGPKRFTTDGVPVNESITLNRETAPIPNHGVNLRATAIVYSGPDERLAKTGTFTTGLTVFDVGPILREWGYAYDADRGRLTPPPQPVPRPTGSHG